MTVRLNPDFQDFIRCFNDSHVEYIVVGGYAVIYYGANRTTGDLDIWVRRSEENYLKITRAFLQFGMPVFDMTRDNFLLNDRMDVFSFGVPPVSIDILTNLKGLSFDKAFDHAVYSVWDSVSVRVLNLQDLIKAKAAAGRYKDLDDIANITAE
jgi:predicted nucleotidyltransferase